MTDRKETTDGVRIADAYDVLTPVAFAAWIRLMIEPTRRLVGRGRVAEMLGRSPRRTNSILRELKLKGYLEVSPSGQIGVPTRFRLLKRALLTGQDHFIKLSSDYGPRAASRGVFSDVG